MNGDVYILHIPNNEHIQSSDGKRFEGEELYLQCFDEFTGHIFFTDDIMWAARYFDQAHAISDCERLYKYSKGMLKPVICKVIYE